MNNKPSRMQVGNMYKIWTDIIAFYSIDDDEGWAFMDSLPITIVALYLGEDNLAKKFGKKGLSEKPIGSVLRGDEYIFELHKYLYKGIIVYHFRESSPDLQWELIQ